MFQFLSIFCLCVIIILSIDYLKKKKFNSKIDISNDEFKKEVLKKYPELVEEDIIGIRNNIGEILRLNYKKICSNTTFDELKKYRIFSDADFELLFCEFEDMVLSNQLDEKEIKKIKIVSDYIYYKNKYKIKLK